MTNKVTNTVLLIFAIALGVMYLNKHQQLANFKKVYKHNLATAHDSIEIFTDRYDRAVANIHAYEVSLGDLKLLNDSLRDVIKKYKPKVVVKYKTQFVYNDTVKIKYDTVINNVFTRKFKYDDKWFSLAGVSTNIGIDINNLVVRDSKSIVVGYKRDGFLKPRYASISVVSDNPYIKYNEIQSYIVKPKRTIFNKWYLWAGLGALTGFLIK